MSLTKERNTKERVGDVHAAPVAADTVIYAGALVALDASGNATPGAVATTLTGFGRAEETADNTDGSAGDISVRVKKGTFLFANSADTDEITRAEIGDNCYIVDDETVAKTSGTNTRSVAGKIIDVDAEGVWVQIA